MGIRLQARVSDAAVLVVRAPHTCADRNLLTMEPREELCPDVFHGVRRGGCREIEERLGIAYVQTGI